MYRNMQTLIVISLVYLLFFFKTDLFFLTLTLIRESEFLKLRVNNYLFYLPILFF